MLRPGQLGDVDPRDPMERPCDVVLANEESCAKPAVRVRGVRRDGDGARGETFVCQEHRWVVEEPFWSRSVVVTPPQDGI